MISVRWENMLGRYTFLYQLEVLQEKAEISKCKNITLSSALPPHIRKRSCKGIFHIAQMPATSNVCKLSQEAVLHFSWWKLPLTQTVGTTPWTEIQVEVYGQRGKCPFCQQPSMNIKIINIFFFHSDLFSYPKNNSSSVFQLHYVCATHHCSHKSNWKSDCFEGLTYPQTRDNFKVLKATGFQYCLWQLQGKGQQIPVERNRMKKQQKDKPHNC